MSGVYTAVASVGLGVYGAVTSADAADDALTAQKDSAAFQYDISQQQLDLSTEQWELYKNEIYPLEQEAQQLGLDYQNIAFEQYRDYYAPLGDQFAQEAMEGIEAQPERVARDARLSVDQQFDTEEGMIQRNLERRGVRPGSGNYEGDINDTSLSRAAAKGYTVNRAIENEMDRVEDVNFNRKATALGRTPTVSGGTTGITPGLASGNLAAAGSTAQSAGSTYGNIASTYGDATAGIVSGGIQLGTAAYDLYNQYSTPPPATYTPTTSVSNDVGFSPAASDFNLAFAEGGEVKAPPQLQRGGYAEGGRVNGPPGVDQVQTYLEGPDGQKYDAKLTHNEYVIPEDVVAAVGTDTLDDIIQNARTRKQKAQQGPNSLSRRQR